MKIKTPLRNSSHLKCQFFDEDCKNRVLGVKERAGLDHLESAGLKSITGSVQKKIYISRGAKEKSIFFNKIWIIERGQGVKGLNQRY